ncbi:MAG: hypothetical protein AAF975_00240 [Spirochaetota bacterium]
MSIRENISPQISPLWRGSLNDKAALWRSGLHGFEREVFRLVAANGRPAAHTHEELFSEARQRRQIATSSTFSRSEQKRLQELLPRALTLDFSDQQLELVSPPHPTIAAAADDIALLLRFAAQGLPQKAGEEELLWAFSQPPLFGPEDLAAVRLARFGSSPDAAYKETYRRQLLLRYGKAKQSWTGIHYNFSLDLRLFEGERISPCMAYVHLGRNLWRVLWLLELLYGCTSAVPQFYARQTQEHFARGGVRLAPPSPYAGSLHADTYYGYRSFEQQAQFLDYSHPCAYWQSIEAMAKVSSPFFAALDLENTRLIQDSRELYTPFRLKQLHAHGDECWEKDECLVDYLELRIIDIDPLSPHDSGIYLNAIYLAHLLLVYSAITESPPLGRAELLGCFEREQIAAGSGRKPEPLLKEALALLGELEELGSLLGFAAPYSEALAEAQGFLQSGKTRAAQFAAQGTAERGGMLATSAAWTKRLQQPDAGAGDHGLGSLPC